MDVKDSISVTLKTIDGKETKDQSAKNIFSYKPIMSNILKYTVEEYRDCSLEEIMNCLDFFFGYLPVYLGNMNKDLNQ